MSDSDKVFAIFSLGAVMQKAQSNSFLENHAKNGKGRYGKCSLVEYNSNSMEKQLDGADSAKAI